ncbi:MAG: hypothetical protein ACM3ZF_04430 [Mycobacterium leprae]
MLVPAPRRVAALLIGLEGAVLVGAGVADALSALRGARVEYAVPGAVLFVAFGLGLVAAAGGLLRRRRWARAPAVVAQLLALPVGFSLTQSGRTPVGVAVLVVAGLALGLVLSPAVGRELGG